MILTARTINPLRTSGVSTQSHLRQLKASLRRFAILAAAPFFPFISIANATPFPLTDTWQSLSKRIAVREIIVHPEALFPSRIVFARISGATEPYPKASPTEQPSRPRLRVLTAQEFGYPVLSAKEIAGHAGASLTINANFFDEKDSPLGAIVVGGILKRQPHRSGRALSGIFQIDRQGPHILHRDTFSPLGVIEAIQAGPRLITSGTPTAGVRDSFSTRRAGICLNKEGEIIVFCVSSGLFTLTMPSLQELLASPTIGCTEALNLDGGGSAQIFARSSLTTQNSTASQEVIVEGIDRVPVFLGFFDNNEESVTKMETPAPKLRPLTELPVHPKKERK